MRSLGQFVPSKRRLDLNQLAFGKAIGARRRDDLIAGFLHQQRLIARNEIHALQTPFEFAAELLRTHRHQGAFARVAVARLRTIC